jgi:peptidoglycan/LPS O-acetylase OafA/YrhL
VVTNRGAGPKVDLVMRPTDAPGRNRALDGLRGAAAVVVLSYHELVATVPSFYRVSHDPAPKNIQVGGAAWWLIYTPLHLLWAGPEAVFLFFVLSGYVLALPALRPRQKAWWASYYTRRTVRLYLPVLASLLLALATVAAIRRGSNAATTWWGHGIAVSGTGVGEALHDAPLVRGAGVLNSPLWSLQYEVIFSIMLPLYIYLARRLAKFRVAEAAVVLIALTAAQHYDLAPLMYLLMFAVGVMMAFQRDFLASMADRVGPGVWCFLLAVSVLLITCSWTTFGIGGNNSWAAHLGAPCLTAAVAGSALMVFMVSEWPAARSLGESRIAQWVGRRSFSLYLTHVPLIAGLLFLLGKTPDALVFLVLCTPAALLLADVFFRLIEAPSHRLAQRLGRSVESGLRRRIEPGAVPAIEAEPAYSQAVSVAVATNMKQP